MHVHENEPIDEERVGEWIRQAAAIPGWDGRQAPKEENAVKSDSNEREAASAEIEESIAASGDWRGETLRQMRKLIQDAEPDVVEEVKWRKPSNPAGVPTWSHDGILCTGETYKEKVKLTFAKGAALPDPQGLFNASLEGNTRRAIDIHEGDSVDARAFKALVREAVALNAMGAKAKRAK